MLENCCAPLLFPQEIFLHQKITTKDFQMSQSFFNGFFLQDRKIIKKWMQSWQFSLHNFKIFTWFFRMMNLLQLLLDQIQVTVQHLLYRRKVQLQVRRGHRLRGDRRHQVREVLQHLLDLHLQRATKKMKIPLEILHLLKKRVMEDSQISPILTPVLR